VIITWDALLYFYPGPMEMKRLVSDETALTAIFLPVSFIFESKKILVYLSIIGLIRDEVNI
jgi:hypothetical protein